VDDEIGVPQPAEPIIPVAAAAGSFGNRGGHGGDDRPAFLKVAELESDGGADDRLLPFEGDRKESRPFAPIVLGFLECVSAGVADRAGEALVRSQDKRNGLLEDERHLVQHEGDRRVGGEPEREVRGDIADVVAAMGPVRPA
jgi:hypothetical protein